MWCEGRGVEGNYKARAHRGTSDGEICSRDVGQRCVGDQDQRYSCVGDILGWRYSCDVEGVKVWCGMVLYL